MNSEAQHPSEFEGWQRLVVPYTVPDTRRATWQVINSFGGFFLTCILMYFSLRIGYWLTVLLAFPAAGFLMRIFIIQHDCGHNSFVKPKNLNNVIGMACSVLTFVPYKYWRKGHAVHHAHHAELEERGIGDIWTMTIEEYKESSLTKRIIYRIFRNPVFLFGIGPIFYFLFLLRLPLTVQENWHNGERSSVWWTNLALAGWMSAIGFWLGFDTLVALVLPIMLVASNAATWLFYVQHQFEHTYWEHTPEWNYTLAAMQGSSYYKLPRILQWFSGNIGFHHIHHLSPRIPNYNLQRCHDENPIFQQVAHLTIPNSLSTINLTLWDEENDRLVTFRDGLSKAQAMPSAA